MNTNDPERLGIHEELHRLVLRKRWIRWSLRTHKSGDYRWPGGKHIRLSNRLTRWKPIWDQRNRGAIEVPAEFRKG